MWFVSQLQNALSGNEPSEQCFMDAVRGVMEGEDKSQTVKLPNSLIRNPYLKSTKPLTPKGQHQDKEQISRSNSVQNLLFSNECMELPEIPPVHKRYLETPSSKTDLAVSENTLVIGKAQSFETRECTVPKAFKNVVSDDTVLLKRECSKVCLNKPQTANAVITSKLSSTHFNTLKYGTGDAIRSKISQSLTSLSLENSFTNSSACNELEPSGLENEIGLDPYLTSGKKCALCNSISTIQSRSESRGKEERVKKLPDIKNSESKKPDPVKNHDKNVFKRSAICLFKRPKKDASTERKPKKKYDEKHDNKSRSKIDIVVEHPRDFRQKDSDKSKSRREYASKRNDLPIHLRPLSPVHNADTTIFRRSLPSTPNCRQLDEVVTNNKRLTTGKSCLDNNSINTALGHAPAEKSCIDNLLNEPRCVTKTTRDGFPKTSANSKSEFGARRDMSTSMDMDALTTTRISPITNYRYRSQLKPPSNTGGFTKIPIPYYFGYSKISTVQEKVSYITGTPRSADFCHERDIANIVYSQIEENKPNKAMSIKSQDFCQKHVIKRQNSCAEKKFLKKEEPKLRSDSHVTLVRPSDLVKRIEMIRRKLAQAESGDAEVEIKTSSTKQVVPYYRLGERGSGFKTSSPLQDFYEIREQHLSQGTLFEDPDFPAEDSSLTFSRRPDRHYEWLRPGEIVDDPQLFVEGYSRFDVQQGELGDCWLLAAVANLTLYRRLFFQIVPDDQSFEDNYAGVFHFRFWQYGRWIDVVIDDRLPTYRGQLVYLHSNEENEFWSALLEKAYAKLHGSYEALKGGSTCEAMEDFTGGVTEMYEMNASPPNLFKIILKAYERGSLMGASLEPDPNVLEAETAEGLVRGHAYSITRVKYVDIQTPNSVGKIPLLRLRNPWGNEIEWRGAWSDQSPEWRFIPEHEKENLGLTFDYDGEFWMSFKDFQKHFDRLEICNLTPDSLTEEEIAQGNKKQWEMSVFEGEWVRGVTAGGCRNYIDTFWHNPQYRITLTDVDDDDDENKCTVIIALMQKNRRSKKQAGVEFLTIGFAVYYLPDPNRAPKPLDLNYFKYNASVARSPSFINLREVSCRFRLPPGTYCIIPSTFEPNDEGEFLLRVFSEHKNNMEYGSSYNYDHDSNSGGSDFHHGQSNNRYNPPRGYAANTNFNPGGYSSFFGSGGGAFDFSSFTNFLQLRQQPNQAASNYPPPQQQQYTNSNYPQPRYSQPNYSQPQHSNPNYPRAQMSHNYPQSPYPVYVQPGPPPPQNRPPYPPPTNQQPPGGSYGFRY